mgnify:CR=1 FL=1
MTATGKGVLIGRNSMPLKGRGAFVGTGLVTSKGAGEKDEMEAIGTSDAAVEYAEKPVLEGTGGEMTTV